ncbi:MAG: stalk domain-containing protein [Bacillota bacterium]|nr:stalk domain-containing protein [Bacillota bacterium]MDW7678290.1 stalk domain-containing protein [Bacillota bacterium]
MAFILDQNTYTVNGELIVMDVSPAIVEGRTLLPIKYAAAPLGAEVSWDNETKKVTVLLDATKLELWIGQSNAVVNGQPVPIDPENPNVKPLIINGRTMLPLRFVTEKLGCDVQWDAVTRKATVTKPAAPGETATKPYVPPILQIVTPPIFQPDIKPDISADLLQLNSIDISMLKQNWGMNEVGKAYKVMMNEADIPVVMRIGRGYDVFAKYASVESLKQPVLDTGKLIQNQRMERIRYDEANSTQTVSESIRSYSQSISTSIGASGSYFGFGGSVKSNFDTTRTQELNNYFSTYSHIVKKYGVYVTGATDLKQYLTIDAKMLLNDNNTPANTVFANFGHFVLVDTITGGRVDYSVTASSEASTSFENFKIAAKADFNAVVFSVGGSGSYQNVKNKSQYDSNKKEEFHSYGGGFTLNASQFKTDPTILTKWEATLEDHGTLVDFGTTTARALVPIWDLCSDSNRAAYLKAEFEKQNKAQGNQWPLQKYVTDIVFVADDDVWVARGKCPPGYQLVDVDLNAEAKGKFIFLTYKLGENINEAYTDFFMEYRTTSQPSATKMVNHNSNYVEYSRIGVDLNWGSGGDFIYLWTTKANTLPPITDMAVAVDKPGSVNPDWHSVYWQNTQSAADVNKSVGGKYIYIKYNR